jgi:hypothetical protein
LKGEIKAQNCESENAQSKNQKFEIATAKRRNRNNFPILRFNLFMFLALAYSRLSFCIFASRRVAGWSMRWTLKPRCRHRCGFDPHVCQGFKAPSLAQGFSDFPVWNIGLPPRLVTLREPHICKTVVHFAVGKLAYYPRTIPAKFGLIQFSGFREEDLNVIFYQNMPNLHNRYKSAERKISQKNPEYMLNYSLPCSCS